MHVEIGGQLVKNLLSPSTSWVPGTEPRAAALAAPLPTEPPPIGIFYLCFNKQRFPEGQRLSH